MKKRLSIFLAVLMLVSVLPVNALAANNDSQNDAEAAVAALNARTGSDFYCELVERYDEPGSDYMTEVRWWVAEGAHTDETIREEIQAIYDAGFRGIELAQLDEGSLNASVYGYGSEQWTHDFKLAMEMALDLGMRVGITSGTNWNTTNIPGLDPDSQQAMQGVFELHQLVEGGASVSGPIPTSRQEPNGSGDFNVISVREVNSFIGAYAFKTVSGTNAPIVVEADSLQDLTDAVTADENGVLSLNWTAPDDGSYYIFYYWQQGTAQESKPATAPSYCVNYFDKRGFEAFTEYFSANVLNDPELNAKILASNGNVQLFMDSLEINPEDCATYWSEAFAEEFQTRKGYDISPYLFLADGLPAVTTYVPVPDVFGTYNLDDAALGQKILNDLHDVQTELYMENYMIPMEAWLNGYGIELRAQISYGRFIEISEPSLTVDYPEAENLNQRNQVDIYRLWSGGAKLENKVLSSETGALAFAAYAYDHQTHLQEAYSLYAAGFSRINWHVWTSSWSPESVNQSWPGFLGGMAAFLHFNALGLREPTYYTYHEMNNHLSRVQMLLREGVSRSDVGMIYMKYGQPIPFSTTAETDMWMQRHDYMLFPSTELQENGYTYDYFSPEFLKSENVCYNAETGTLELAGYKALVLWQDWLTVEGAKNILELAKQGLKVVVVAGAAVQTPYHDGGEAELSAIISELETLNNVKTAATADDVMEALQAMGVEPYAAFAEENLQLLTQVRQDGDGNQYLYVYNYCDGYLHDGDDPDHGLNARVDVAMDGIFLPYMINSWTGEVVQLAEYRYEDGKTIITVDLDYGDIALYAFESVDGEDVHVVASSGGDIYTAADGTVILRADKSGTYVTTLNDGTICTNTLEVPASYSITGWDLTVEAWSAGDRITRTDTYTDSQGNTSVEYTYNTAKTNIDVHLDELVKWNRIHEVGVGVSGRGYYSAEFNWDGKADGAYLDFGSLLNSMEVYINGIETTDLNMNIPVLDISDYLVVGTNTIELVYNSNLSNKLLETGWFTEQPLAWAGYDIAYRAYGPAQALVIPYVEVAVSAELETPAQPQKPTEPTKELKVGDTVNFTGKTHYATVYDVIGYACKPGAAKITAIYTKDGARYYHLIAVKGGGSSVYGWVDAADIAEYVAPAEPVQPESPSEGQSVTFAKGDKVTVNNGAKTYTGERLASFVYQNTYTVISVKGNRVVIGVNGVVTAAMNATDLAPAQ